MESWRWSPLWTSVCPWITQGTTVMPDQLGMSGKLRREVSGGAKDLQLPPSRLITACWWLEMVHPDCRRPGRKQKGPAERWEPAGPKRTDMQGQAKEKGGKTLKKEVVICCVVSRPTPSHLGKPDEFSPECTWGWWGRFQIIYVPDFPLSALLLSFPPCHQCFQQRIEGKKYQDRDSDQGKESFGMQCLQPCLYVGRD